MKFFSLLLLSISSLVVTGQSDCSEYYPFVQGTVTEWTTYDKKDKPSAVIEYVVKEAGQNKVTIKNTVSDKKGEEISTSEFDIICKGDGVELDITSMYSPQLMAQYENMETSISGTDVSLPNNMQVGDELDDVEMFISVDMSGINMNIEVAMTDRKVVEKETISVPAGSFDCVVISYNNKMKMGLERKTTGKQWIAKGVGMVKQEEYNKRGKLTSSTKLTNFKN